MKKLLFAFALVAGAVLFSPKTEAQVYVGARVGFSAPYHRLYVPRLVYRAPVAIPYCGSSFYDRPGYYRHGYIRPYYGYGRVGRFRRW